MTPYTPYQPPPAPMPFRPPPLPPIPGPRLARRRTAVLLGVLAVLLSLTGGAFGVLYVTAVGEHGAAVERLAEKKDELAGVSDQLAATEDEQEQAEQRKTDLEATRTDLTSCVEAAQHWLWDDLTTAAADSALDAMYAACR